MHLLNWKMWYFVGRYCQSVTVNVVSTVLGAVVGLPPALHSHQLGQCVHCTVS